MKNLTDYYMEKNATGLSEAKILKAVKARLKSRGLDQRKSKLFLRGGDPHKEVKNIQYNIPSKRVWKGMRKSVGLE